NISLVPQALSGQVPQAPSREDGDYRGRRRKRGKDIGAPSLEKGIVNVFAGLGFLVAALAIMYKFPGGIFWGWSFFFPAFDRLGRGIATLIAVRKQAASLPPGQSQMYIGPPQQSSGTPSLAELRARRTGELVSQPASVTEGTTRHLGAEAPTRHLDSENDYQK
ncbi:MAG: hypothetical protein M3R68_08160, partial [Acidobacteriota bacterium]|nr:hypothetical protein [Acidobacteriota bacterium]